MFNTMLSAFREVYFSPQNAPKPFDDRAVCSLRPLASLKGWGPGKRKGGSEREERMEGQRMDTPNF